MVFFGFRPGRSGSTVSPPFDSGLDGFTHSASNVHSLIESGNQHGLHKRKVMRWKTPNLGWVKMFLNPNQISISEAKDIESTRTKAGFVLQYAGEKLTDINISGTTGSAGIEGINILRAVYRSEQTAFDRIAQELERTSPIAEAMSIGAGLLDTDSSYGLNLSKLSDIALNFINQPFPTLASLAANVELYFQGELFRGYFTEFSVEENAEKQGMFEYKINFKAHSRQGIRRNFMPWHRQPFNPIGMSGRDPNPHSYDNGEYNKGGAANELVEAAQNVLRDAVNNSAPTNTSGFTKRNTSSGSSANGASLTDQDLEDSQ